MKLISILVLLMISVGSLADEESTLKAAWTCYAQGRQSPFGPGGDIWTTVRGDGATELEAADTAFQACLSQGLQMCSPLGCHENH